MPMCLGNEPCHEKTNILVSDQVQHKPGCTATEATEDGERLEISDLETVEGLYYLCSENKGADQLRGHRICEMLVFS